MKKEINKYLKKFWFLVWKDDSWKGWIISIIVLFIIIKWVLFPFLSLITGTTLPLAIVESCSMYHDNGIFHEYDSWWDYKRSNYNDFNINKENFSRFIFKNGFNKGDILFIIKANPEKLKVGDVIVFQATTTNPVIHRIVKIKEEDGKKIFSTIGDNNPRQIDFEKEILEEQLVGKAILKLAPYAGWIKLIFYESKRTQNQRGFCEMN